jgi:predicted PurR-regulated permease PerM
MIFGIFFTAIIQGTLAGIGYAVVGIPNPIFWATATALFSLVPLLGTAIIWVPASIILAIMGNYVGAIGLFAWGVLVVGTVDNFIRPYLIEGRAPVHPLLTFLAVLGGILAFGLKGVLYGPIILNLLLAFLHIYEIEYAKVLKN